MSILCAVFISCAACAPLLVVWDLDAVGGDEHVRLGERPPLEKLERVAEPSGDGN